MKKKQKIWEGKTLLRNEKIYFGGRIKNGGAILLFSFMGNLAKGLLGGL